MRFVDSNANITNLHLQGIDSPELLTKLTKPEEEIAAKTNTQDIAVTPQHIPGGCFHHLHVGVNERVQSHLHHS